MKNTPATDPQEPPGELPSPREFYLAEYEALRNEIIKRTEIQHQLISLALIATGTFLTFATPTGKLGYPIIGLFLAAAWVHNDCQIARMGWYIQQRIEPQALGSLGGWEKFHLAARPISIFGPVRFGSLEHFASRGLLLGTQVLAVLIALLTAHSINRSLGFLALLDAAIIAFTALLLRRHDLGFNLTAREAE